MRDTLVNPSLQTYESMFLLDLMYLGKNLAGWGFAKEDI
jgi:hypothetical protein